MGKNFGLAVNHASLVLTTMVRVRARVRFFFYISFSFCPDIIPSKIDMKWYFNIFWVDVLSSFCVTFMNFDDISCILTCYFQTLITLRCNDPVTSNYLQSKGQDLGYNCDHTSSERLEVIFGVKLTPKVDPLFKYWIKKS